MADISALHEGQAVQIWSNSQQRWNDGHVAAKTFDQDRGGLLVLIRYGQLEKWLDTALTASD